MLPKDRSHAEERWDVERSGGRPTAAGCAAEEGGIGGLHDVPSLQQASPGRDHHLRVSSYVWVPLLLISNDEIWVSWTFDFVVIVRGIVDFTMYVDCRGILGLVIWADIGLSRHWEFAEASQRSLKGWIRRCGSRVCWGFPVVVVSYVGFVWMEFRDEEDGFSSMYFKSFEIFLFLSSCGLLHEVVRYELNWK